MMHSHSYVGDEAARGGVCLSKTSSKTGFLRGSSKLAVVGVVCLLLLTAFQILSFGAICVLAVRAHSVAHEYSIAVSEPFVSYNARSQQRELHPPPLSPRGVFESAVVANELLANVNAIVEILRERVEQLEGGTDDAGGGAVRADGAGADVGKGLRLSKADAVYLIRNATETASTLTSLARQVNVTAVNAILSTASSVDPESAFGVRFDRAVADAERLGTMLSGLAVSFATTQQQQQQEQQQTEQQEPTE